MKKPITIIFICIIAIQLFVPANMIIGREMTLKTGRQYKFKTAPVDPYDPFRGKYVALNFEQQRAPTLNKEDNIKYGQWVYVHLATDSDGFVKLTGVTKTKPDHNDYIRARAISKYNTSDIRLDLPFNRYYMDENMAPEAERVYRDQNRRGSGKTPAYVTVRVRSGTVVLENLYINDMPVNEYIKNNMK